jgi:hypothetical protein
LAAGKFHLPPPPPPMSRSHFFASSGACAGSGHFLPQECVRAFEEVETLLNERAPKFASRSECVAAFRICDKSPAGTYLPAILGVEIVRSPKGLAPLPMLAVETPPELLRKPEPPTRVVDIAPRRVEPPPSPFGALGLEGMNKASERPKSLKGYRLLLEEAQLRFVAFAQNVKPGVNWRAER